MKKFMLARRFKLALLFVLAGIALVAVPAVQGAPPIRNVFPAPEPFVYPSGLRVCVRRSGRPGWLALDHRVQRWPHRDHGHGDITLTNLETGTSYLQYSRYDETVTFPDANTAETVINGRVIVEFYPGDQGPVRRDRRERWSDGVRRHGVDDG